jgi:hypothetical protein
MKERQEQHFQLPNSFSKNRSQGMKATLFAWRFVDEALRSMQIQSSVCQRSPLDFGADEEEA